MPCRLLLLLLLSAPFTELQDASSVVSDYDCPCAEVSHSVEDLLGLSSLRNSEFFEDLEGGIPTSQFTTFSESKTKSVDQKVSVKIDSPAISKPVQTANELSLPYLEEPRHNFLVTHLSPKLVPGCLSSDSSDPAAGFSVTINLNGLLETMEPSKGSEEVKENPTIDIDGEPDEDSFPILVRSMSTSRRHSWGAPLSPINLGRR